MTRTARRGLLATGCCPRWRLHWSASWISMMKLVGKLTRIVFPRLAKLEHHHVATPLIFRAANG